MLTRTLTALGAIAVVLALAVGGLLLFAPGLHTTSLEMVLNLMTGRGSDLPPDSLLARLRAAEGYRLSVFARDLPNPRMLARDAEGRLLVSNPRSGEILILEDTDGDGAADDRRVLLAELRRPHGIAIHDGFLFVAESHQLGRIAYRHSRGQVTGEYSVIAGGLTDNGNHWSKSVAVDEGGQVFLSQGSTCNVCLEEDLRRATIMRMDTDGGNPRIYASGLRNSVGLDFAPWSGALYATDNGRDLLGDDYPPCELNRIVDGGFYGWPFYNGDNQPDPDFGDQTDKLTSPAQPPVFDFRAHNAPLGIHFIDSGQRAALVALHGSWNRSTPDGYRVVKLRWGAGDDITASDFVWGFERDGDIVGRPVDIESDGAEGFYISDDYARVIYRVSTNIALKSAGAGAVGSGDRRGTPSVDAALATAGAALYTSMPCDDCHGGAADTPVSLNGLSERYSVESLADYFLTPTPPMPLYEMSEFERRQLAHFLLGRETGLPSG